MWASQHVLAWEVRALWSHLSMKQPRPRSKEAKERQRNQQFAKLWKESLKESVPIVYEQPDYQFYEPLGLYQMHDSLHRRSALYPQSFVVMRDCGACEKRSEIPEGDYLCPECRRSAN